MYIATGLIIHYFMAITTIMDNWFVVINFSACMPIFDPNHMRLMGNAVTEVSINQCNYNNFLQSWLK